MTLIIEGLKQPTKFNACSKCQVLNNQILETSRFTGNPNMHIKCYVTGFRIRHIVDLRRVTMVTIGENKRWTQRATHILTNFNIVEGTQIYYNKDEVTKECPGLKDG